MNKYVEFAEFFGLQLLSYFLFTVNFRAIAQGRYWWTASSDMCIAAVNFFLISKIADSKKSKTALAGYVIGGMIGSLIAIYITKALFGS